MKGLLLKDLYMTWKYCRAYLLVIGFFLLCSILVRDNLFYMLYPSVMSSLIPMTLQSYDEQSKWQQTSLTMPCSRAQLVSAKYLVGVITGGVVVVAAAVIQGILMLAGIGVWAQRWQEWLGCVALVFSGCCIAPATSLPFLFRFGAEKARIYQSVIVGVFCGGTVILSFGFPEFLNQVVMWKGCLPVMVLFSVACYAASWWLSIRFYQKREF